MKREGGFQYNFAILLSPLEEVSKFALECKCVEQMPFFRVNVFLA